MTRRTLFACAVLLSTSSCSSTSAGPAPVVLTKEACAADGFDTLLQKYAPAGRVDYVAWKASKADSDAFDAYLTRLGSCDATKLEGLEPHAFWINAYNAYNIKGVLDAWPIENIKSVPGFLDKKTWHVANADLTLNDIEYKRLIPAIKDARAHFACVCADLGSVAIAPRAYTAANLDASLDAKAREFAKDPRNLTVDVPGKVVSVSMLFSPEWYEKDFLVDPKFKGKKAVEFLVTYVDATTATFLTGGDYTVKYLDWDWSLNGKK